MLSGVSFCHGFVHQKYPIERASFYLSYISPESLN